MSGLSPPIQQGPRERAPLERARGPGSLKDVFHHGEVRRWIRRLRVPAYLLAIAAVARFADPGWLAPGLALSAVGGALQLWCLACIHTHKTLATNGPYAFVRNPIYLSRYVLILGLLLVPGAPWAAVPFTLLYALYAVARVEREEDGLHADLGEDYTAYCRRVPRFLPALEPVEGARVWFANRDWFHRNHGVRQAAFLVAAYVVVGLA